MLDVLVRFRRRWVWSKMNMMRVSGRQVLEAYAVHCTIHCRKHIKRSEGLLTALDHIVGTPCHAHLFYEPSMLIYVLFFANSTLRIK